MSRIEASRPGPGPGPAALQLIVESIRGSLGNTKFSRDLMALVERWSAGGDDLSVLPELTCAACGSDVCQALPSVAAWQLTRWAAKMLDDVEDGDLKDGYPTAVNLAVALLFVAQAVLHDKPPQPQSEVARSAWHAAAELARACLIACDGQNSDLTLAPVDPDGWLEMARAKSGALFAWGAWSGALAAGASETVLDAYADFGLNLGILLQVADDYNGMWYPDGVSDLARGKITLPVAFGLSIAEGTQLVDLQTALVDAKRSDGAGEQRARQMLVDLGAQAYLLVVGRLYERQAEEALSRCGPTQSPDPRLEVLLHQIFPAAHRSDR